ncbi:MAG: hypothetical protein JOY69_06115, partial [Candidatus Eremiobacteraeota bacterium]|nr:hypothetical protein [Candidatus Eremiobacteraeota bacterium]
MKIGSSTKRPAAICAFAALLAACTPSGSRLTPNGGSMGSADHHALDPTPGTARSRTLLTPPSVTLHFRHVYSTKPVKPNCCALQKTLFVSDAFGGSSFTGAVYAFDYNSGASLGILAAPPEGWLEVQGACADDSGNVYFANTEKSTIDEYSHSGTFITALADPNQYPVGCAFDRTTGNLAVSNITSVSGGPGSLSIYHDGVLQHVYLPPNMDRVYFLGYEDSTGILWLDGENSSGLFQYDSFSGGTFVPVMITGGAIAFPGAVMWSGKTKTMVVGDQSTFSAPTFYQVDDAGHIVGETVLQCTQQSDFCDPVQATIKGPGLVSPDAAELGVARYAFPAGGSPILQYVAPYV